MLNTVRKKNIQMAGTVQQLIPDGKNKMEVNDNHKLQFSTLKMWAFW
jgi:translation initiation factor IF-1